MILRGMDRGRYATDAPPRKVPSAGASDNSSRLYRDAVRPTLKTFRVRTKDPYTNAASHDARSGPEEALHRYSDETVQSNGYSASQLHDKYVVAMFQPRLKG